MRKVTAHLFSSADGVVESPNLFQFDRFGPEEGEAMGRALAPVTDVILGRKLYDEWSGHFAGNDEDFGAFINPVTKHVASHTVLVGQGGDSSTSWPSPSGSTSSAARSPRAATRC